MRSQFGDFVGPSQKFSRVARFEAVGVASQVSDNRVVLAEQPPAPAGTRSQRGDQSVPKRSLFQLQFTLSREPSTRPAHDDLLKRLVRSQVCEDDFALLVQV